MDIQGAEYLALLGMQKLIKSQENVIMISEYWPMGIDKTGYNPSKYIKLLNKNHFRILQLNEHTNRYNILKENELYKDITINNKKYTNLVCIKSTYGSYCKKYCFF